MPKTLLILRGVEAGYRNRQILFGVDLDVREGEVVVLLGANGSGKSTLLNAIGGFVPAMARFDSAGWRRASQVAASPHISLRRGPGVTNARSVSRNVR